jgi:hypothetical protein
MPNISTSDSSEDGVTGNDEGSSNSDEDMGRVAKNVHGIIEQRIGSGKVKQVENSSKRRNVGLEMPNGNP